jgi:hypothetical protein
LGRAFAVVSVRALAIEMVTSLEARDELESTTRTVKLYDPEVVGEPSNFPSEWKASPGGSAPALTDQMYAGAPPAASIVN